MLDTIFTIILGVSIVFVLIGMLGYIITTNAVIKDQNRKIAYLTEQLRQERQKSPLVIEKSGKTPDFGGF